MASTLPNFLCVGAQKAGTTSLQTILIQHPDIFLAQPKEAHFFDRDDKYSKGLEWYQQHYFSEREHEKAVGDITPEYMFCEQSPKRIYDSLGDGVKLIFSLRDPVERAYSHYLMSARRGYDDLAFPDAIRAEEARMKRGDFEHWHHSYIARGYYAQQIERFLEYFPPENMFFIIFETDFLHNRNATFGRLMQFLEVDPIELDVEKKANPATEPKYKSLHNLLVKDNYLKRLGKAFLPVKAYRNRLRKYYNRTLLVDTQKEALDRGLAREVFETYFQRDVDKLEATIGRDLGVWRQTG